MINLFWILCGRYLEMSKPIFSFIAAAKRDYAYKNFYNSLSYKNNISFEVIFVGPNPPKENIGENFKYVKTNVKPAQCVEYAARIADGEYILDASDDLSFSENFLDNLYNWCNRLDRDKILIGCRLYLPEHKMMCDSGMVYDLNNNKSAFLHVLPCFRKDIWRNLGGIDRRYYGSWSDVDMQLRFYEIGMNPFIAPNCIVSEETYWHLEDKRQVLSKRCWKGAKSLTNSFWVEERFLGGKRMGMIEGGEMSSKRLLPVQSFLDKDILTMDQN